MSRIATFKQVYPVAGLFLLFALGCSGGGAKTVPVKGTLKIDGQPADNVTISLVPEDSTKEPASGPVKGGNFELYTGVQGTKGAVPGKYKVTLAASGGGSMEQAKSGYMGGGAGGKSSAPPKIEAPFPDKYLSANTSDKQVEITSGDNNLTIEINSK